MYSYEDRIRAVELYIKLGKRVGPTIRQLGYPTKNALKGWHRDFEFRLDLPMGYARRDARRAITDIFETNHRCYGYRRLQASLIRQHVTLSEKVVQRLMKQESLVVAKPKRRRYGSYLGEISPAPENIINRDFQADAPNEKWLTDITEFQIPAGKVYLSPIIDCFDGMVVSWTLGTSPDAELVNTMLDAAIETVAETTERPVVHSDRGGHYRWPGWLTRMRDCGVSWMREPLDRVAGSSSCTTSAGTRLVFRRLPVRFQVENTAL